MSTGPALAPTSSIVDRVAAFVERFVFLKHKPIYKLISLWIITTHLHQFFEYTGYLFIHSPDKQCGKTRLLEILNLLVLNSTGIDSSPTAAVVARTAWGNTQLLDEGDGWPDLCGLRNILNAGFQRNARTYRCQQDNLGSHKPQLLKIYCPRAIAGIGKDILSGTTRDRTFTVEMARQTREERRAELRGRLHEPQAAQLKTEIETWAKTHHEQVIAFYDSLVENPLPYLNGLGDRTKDISDPLCSILEVAYANQPKELQRARVELCDAIAHSREEENQYSDDHRLLTAIDVMMEGEELIEQPSVLAHRLNGSQRTEFNEFAIGEILRRYGFPHKSARKDGGPPRKCYVIERSQLKDILARYTS